MTIKSLSQWFMIIYKSGWIIQFELFYFSPTLKDSNLYGHMTPLWCHWIDGYMTLPLGLPGYRVIVWRWNNWNVQSNKVNYWWKPQGRKQYESMNSPWKYTFKESWDKNKTTLVRYSVQQEPWKIRQGRNPESEGRRTPEEIAKAGILSPKDGEPSKKIAKAENLSLKDAWLNYLKPFLRGLDEGFLPWRFLRWFWLNRIPYSAFLISVIILHEISITLYH